MLSTILINLLIGVLGILFYTFLDSKKYFLDKELPEWNLTVLVSDNLKSWLWMTPLVFISAVLSGISPELLTTFNFYLGIDLVSSPVGFFTLGLILKSVIKK